MYVDKPDLNDICDELYHYGTPRHSGRYPWGSGENPYQRDEFIKRINELKKDGMSDAKIAEYFGFGSSTELRAKKAIAVNEQKTHNINRATELREKGYSTSEIGRMMNVNESTVRGWLKAGQDIKKDITNNTVDLLKKNVDEKGFIDIGTGIETELGITRGRLDTAAAILKEQGYEVYTIDVPQITDPNHKTKVKVIAPPGTKWGDVRYGLDKIQTINEYSPDKGNTFRPLQPPASFDSKRLQVLYAEDGGIEKDGMIELRRGVPELSLGNSRYAQVRICVDGTHYLKGMAVYADDLPDGIDIRFNSNKPKGMPIMGPDKDNSVLKPMKKDPDNPFGATIKANGQSEYLGKDGKMHLSPINKVNEEGDWNGWSKTLASQMLSKQDKSLVDKQLKLSYSERKDEFDEIMRLENPVVKQILLEKFADNCDSAAVTLKAAGLPRMQSHVLLSIPELKENEIYAPNYRNGEHVVLIRYPHGGIFEIPELVVNNKNPKAKAILGNAPDAVGINRAAAIKLSGADFDGDTAMVIPANGPGSKIKIKRLDHLEGLTGFDPSEKYPAYPGMKRMNNTQTEMGKITNLITDMTLMGAPNSDLAKAVRHSMVIIDAEKHNLNYKQSEIDNDIAGLKSKYQGGSNKGAGSIISRASAEVYVNERKYAYKPDPETGKKIFEETGRTYTKYDKKTGKTKEVVAQQKMARMDLVDDAFELTSGPKGTVGNAKEASYASYANKLKALANESRKVAVNMKMPQADPVAKKKYASEVASLTASLNTALKNAPKERQAQLIANVTVQTKKDANPELKNNPDELKKVKNQALATARIRVGSHKQLVSIPISEKEWEAIQANAISASKLRNILNNTDMDVVKQYAMPRNAKTNLTSGRISRIKAMDASGYSIAEIADALGISRSTVKEYI